MEISALVNPAPDAPHRSTSNPRSLTAPSPATSAAKLPTPPLSTHKPLITHRRKRHDPKPIWAIREYETYEGQIVEHREQRQHSRPPSAPRPQSQPTSATQSNGPSPAIARQHTFPPQELVGLERPVTNDAKVYDEMVRNICDFIWHNVVDNRDLRSAVAESPGSQIEIEARWGQIVDRNSGHRIQGIHDTECIVKPYMSEHTKFESTMSLEQHKKMNQFLNGHVSKSKQQGAMRAEVDYKHTKESDNFYMLDQNGFSLLPPPIRQLIVQTNAPQRIRVTRDMKTNQIIRKIIKHRIENLEISSPKTEWDYRIGINLEIDFPGPIEGLEPAVEKGRSAESMERKKDRVSYSWMSAYQIDLTQVVQGKIRNHELELELDAGAVMEAADNISRSLPSDFEALVTGMLNNLRVLSREITPQRQS